MYDNVNSISHRGDFARACLALWDYRAPFGAYNITNPGFVTTRQVVEMIRKILGEEPESLSAVAPGTPDWLDELVTKMLAKEPLQRPGSLDAVADELDLEIQRRAP